MKHKTIVKLMVVNHRESPIFWQQSQRKLSPPVREPLDFETNRSFLLKIYVECLTEWTTERDTLMDSKKIYRERYWMNLDAPLSRFSVIRRFLCKRIFWYSDRRGSTRTEAGLRSSRRIRIGTYPRDNADFLATEHFIPHVCVSGGGK